MTKHFYTLYLLIKVYQYSVQFVRCPASIFSTYLHLLS